MTTAKLSIEAKKALVDTGSSHVGRTVPALTEEVRQELEGLGYVGPEGGLTTKGSIARERLVEAALDAFFN